MSQNIAKREFEIFNAKSYHVGIVVGAFNYEVTDKLLESAVEMCHKYSIPDDNIKIYHVAGSVEIPVILKALAGEKYDCLVALGAIIRGDTPHFDYVAKIVSEGVLQVMMTSGIPVGFGVLTCENIEQAQARLHTGGGAVEAALQSAKIIKNL
ncbi:MAG: 6,7-dimethyl-8-ribityllumazine synthase [Patescibacteria group bacterium]|nr:6,7-dimethyl-8-ribityllumazine synthase [Patescibacteria group bacterium]